MSVYWARPLLLLLPLGAPALALGQEPLDFPLGELDAGSHTFPRREGNAFSLHLRHQLVSGVQYFLQVSIRRRVIATVELPTTTRAQVQPTRDADCQTVVRATSDIIGAPDEAAVKAAVEFAEAVLGNRAFTDCEEEQGQLRTTLLLTQSNHPIGSVRSDEDLVVAVTRKGDQDTDTRVWTITYAGRDRGQWLTTYGFTYVTDLFAGDKSYSTRVVEGEEGQFLIRGSDSNSKLAFVPSIMISWLPEQHDELQFVFSGGLGFDLTDPVVMLSPIGINYNQNLTLHIGVAAAKVNRLLTQYDVGQEIGEDLTAEQLQERVYRINPFASLSFNLSTNPFGTAKPDEEEQSGESVPPER